MPYLSSGAGSSTFLPSPETNLPDQSLPALTLTNMPLALVAEEGEPDTEVPQGEGGPDTEVSQGEGGPDTEVPQGEMPRVTDPFSELAEEKPNGKLKRNFCANEYVGDAKRIKAHFAGVRSESPEVLKGEQVVVLSNRRGNDEGSSNPEETSIAAMPYLSSVAGARKHAALAESQPGTHWLADKTMTSLERKLGVLISSHLADMNKLKSEWRRREEAYWSLVARAESQPGTSRLADTTMPPLKRKLRALIISRLADMDKLKSKWRRIKDEYWSVARAIEEGISFPPEKVAEVEEVSKEIKEIFLVLGRFWQETTALVRRSKTSPSVTIELVGKETPRKANEIFSYLMQDNVSIIGVYGMGGVGKTAILRHVYNRLHEDLALDVFWVAVPQDFSVYALQEEIASAVGLNLSKEKDVKRRAGLLCGHLNVKNRSILILDGLWMHFEVKDAGIPVETGNLKLVVTTRSLDVCDMMPCQKQIKVEVLDMEDSWRLFSKTLCFAGALPKEVEQIARSLLDRCGGLPLGIIEVATRMRGAEKVHEWRRLLGELEDSWTELDVFRSLQLSYLKLGDDQVRRCFLHLVLRFGEENDLLAASIEDLIESFIDGGLLGGSATRRGPHDRGYTILDKMRRASLTARSFQEQFLSHGLTCADRLHLLFSFNQIKKPWLSFLYGIVEQTT